MPAYISQILSLIAIFGFYNAALFFDNYSLHKTFDEQLLYSKIKLGRHKEIPNGECALKRLQTPTIDYVVDELRTEASCRFNLQHPSQNSSKAMCISAAPERDVLPNNVKPTHYDLDLEPDLNNFTTKGKLSVKLVVNSTTNKIHLNFNDLMIHSAELDIPNIQKAISIEHNEEKETVILTFSTPIEAGCSGHLTLVFESKINDKLAGFYRSAYTDASGNQKYMAVTQFEPTDARRAFPCWDEPNLKATFSISMTVDSQLTALSNMSVEAESVRSDSKKIVKFRKTPIMSTYLVAFIVGELEYIESKTKGGIAVRVYTPPRLSSQGSFALECGTRILDFFTDYFGIPYPLDKMDMVAIPDFGSGAMENWGLVTYRTVYLLFDENNSTTSTKQHVAYVVGHELAHQWFGNLVTMDWWTDLWLNEGFATWVGTLAADHLYPEWQSWTQFIVDDLSKGLELDSLKASHPIEVDVKNPSEINQIFDSISYSKGASVIRMLANYIGEKDFKKGLHEYLKKFSYSNATTKDLWESLHQASGKNIEAMMSSWTRQVGFPLVDVEIDGRELVVHQTRYLSDGTSDDTQKWFIPLGVAVTDKNNNLNYASYDLLASSAMWKLPSDQSFFKINANTNGFFRVKYPTKVLKNICNMIDKHEISAEDRIGIINDAFALAMSGHYSTVVPLSLLKHFPSEDNYVVWSELAGSLFSILSIWWNEPKSVVQKLEEIVQNLCNKQYKRLGFDPSKNEDDVTGLFRTLIINMAGKTNHPDVVAECKKRFAKFVAGDESAIPANLRGTVLAIAVKNGGLTEWEQTLNLYKTSKIADQKLHALRALGFSKDPQILEKALNLTFDESVRQQDVMYILATVGANPFGRRLAWDFVKQNWSKFYDAFYRGSISLLSRVVSSTTENFTSPEDAADVRAFFAEKDVSSIDRTIVQSIERINISASLLARDAINVQKWVESSKMF